MRKLMKRRALTLLLIFILPIALNTLLVNADAGGTGKYLTVEIVGDGEVIATKEKSGETWTFIYADPAQTEKVGAGTVLLEAFAYEGWVFSHWEEDLIGITENPTLYKTVKYGHVIAVFVRTTFTISATVVGDGAILVDGEVLVGPDSSGEMIVEYGATPTFEFETDLRISSIILTDGPLEPPFPESYTFPPVTADQSIVVIFDEAGYATVLPGQDQIVSPYEGAIVGITAPEGGVIEGGFADYPLGAAAAIHVIDVEFVFGGMLLTLEYDDTDLSYEEELNLRVIHGETLDAVRCDVNGDAEVDGTDVSIVANAVKKYPDWYDPACDINNDNRVTEDDLQIVNENKGAFLEVLDGVVNPDNNTIQVFVSYNGYYFIR